MKRFDSRNSNSGLSLIAVSMLYILLIVLVLFFSRQILRDIATGASLTRLVYIPLGIVFPAFLIVSVAIRLIALFRESRQAKPGSKFKSRLTFFFLIISVFATVPQGILTLTFINSSLKAWFNVEMEEALEGGLSIALRYNNERVQQLESFTTSNTYAGLLELYGTSDPEKLWRLIKEVSPGLGALQLFDAQGTSVAFFGSPQVFLEEAPPEGPEGAVSRSSRDKLTLLRTSRKIPGGPQGDRAVLHALLPEGFDKAGSSLTNALAVFDQYRSYKDYFQFALILLYAIFAFPLLLLSLLIAFQTANLIVRPIVHLEEAMRRVMEGDYSIRMLSGGKDELGILVQSFNDMAGELELSRYKLLQTEKVTAWQEIAQRMAHEIKNPLTPIKLSAERILRAKGKPADQLEPIITRSVASINREVDRLTRMLQEFRDFARMPNPKIRSVHLKAAVEEAVGAYADAYPSVHCSSEKIDKDQHIMADPTQIRQVFSNLIKNAFEASHRDDGSGEIRISNDLVRKGNTLYSRIQIWDNGCGVPDELRSKVFQPYVTTKHGGSGLGLPIVERIVSDHHGAIWFETESSVGTTFFIDIPAEQE